MMMILIITIFIIILIIITILNIITLQLNLLFPFYDVVCSPRLIQDRKLTEKV